MSLRGTGMQSHSVWRSHWGSWLASRSRDVSVRNQPNLRPWNRSLLKQTFATRSVCICHTGDEALLESSGWGRGCCSTPHGLREAPTGSDPASMSALLKGEALSESRLRTV